MAPDLPSDPSKKGRQIFTVSELNRKIRSSLEQEFPILWIEGEISNLRIPSSGHCYFTLKDETSQLRAVIFKNMHRLLKFKPKDGMQVILRGRITVYEQRGEYQIIGDLLEPKGKGSLQEAFEQLKKKLVKEGLFDERHKKPISPFPHKIALITSPTGAVVRDLIRIITRRFEGIHLVVFPVRVQGEGAAEEIAKAVGSANRMPGVDVIIVGRGGGSLEDLWAFNEESVARAIFDSRVPVVSAVGHETDFTIADFAADLRASTPSAAAELVVPEKEGVLFFLSESLQRMLQVVSKKLGQERNRLSGFMGRKAMISPISIMSQHLIRLDDFQDRLVRSIILGIREKRQEFAGYRTQIRMLSPLLRVGRLRSILTERQREIMAGGKAKMLLHREKTEGTISRFFSRIPTGLVRNNRETLQSFNVLLTERMSERTRAIRDRIGGNIGKLEALSPLSVLFRGYSFCRISETGAILKDSAQVKEGDWIDVTLNRGELRCPVHKVIVPPKE